MKLPYKYWGLLLGVMVLGPMVLTACTPTTGEITETGVVTPEPTPTEEVSLRGRGDTLRMLYWQAPTNLNPHLATGVKDFDASRLTYEPLASFNRAGNLIPFLAAEIPSLENGGVAADGKSVTWKLKQGLFWSDGEPFTADDVLFTYEFITTPGTNATSADSYKTVKDVEVVDDHTVKINFNDVNPAWSVPFVGIRGMILPRHIFADYIGLKAQDAPANMLPVGTGPYRVMPPGIKPQEVLFLGTQIVETNKIVYEPNPYFREEDKPYFRQVELRGGGTATEAARLLFETDEVDYVWNLQVDAELLTEYQALGRAEIAVNPGPYVERIALNFADPSTETADGERANRQTMHPFFNENVVREAMTYAIDRERVSELYFENPPTSNILVAPLVYNSPNTSYEFNLEQAAAMLDEAGWVDTDGDGVRDKEGVELQIDFQTSANPVRQATQKIVKDALESIGVSVRIEVIDASVYFGTDPNNPRSYRHFYADFEEYFHGNQSPDPGSYMSFWTCSQIPQKSNNWTGENVSRWCNLKYDSLYQQATVELDPEKRQQLFIEMNDLIINDVVLIPLVNRTQVSGVSNTLEGVELTPWDADTWKIKDWRRKPSS